MTAKIIFSIDRDTRTTPIGVGKTLAECKTLAEKGYKKHKRHYDSGHLVPVFEFAEYKDILWMDSRYYNVLTRDLTNHLKAKWFWCERCKKMEPR